jgi:hypothetical protein
VPMHANIFELHGKVKERRAINKTQIARAKRTVLLCFFNDGCREQFVNFTL